MNDQDRLLDAELAPIVDLLTDPAITNIHVNPDGSVFARRGAGDESTGIEMRASARLALLRTLAALEGQTITRESPLLECKLDRYGIRVAGVMPPVTTAPTLVLRRRHERRLRLDDYVGQGALARDEAVYLVRALRARKTVVVAGATDSGKTTLTNALLAEIEELEPDVRLVILEEDVLELETKSSNAIHLLANAEQTASSLLRLCLRMNPDRIIIGEARGPECYQWLRAANTGHPGGLLTIHANSAESVVERIADLVAEAGVTPSQMRIAETIDVVLFMEKDPDTGRRTISAIREIDFEQAPSFSSPSLPIHSSLEEIP